MPTSIFSEHRLLAIRLSLITIVVKITKSRIRASVAFLNSPHKMMYIHATTLILLGGISRYSAPPGFGRKPSSRGLATCTLLQASLLCTLQSFVPFAWKRSQNTDQRTRQLHTFVFRPFQRHRCTQACASMSVVCLNGRVGRKR